MGALRRLIPYPARLMAYAALLAGAATALAVLPAGPPAAAAPQVAALVTGHPASLRMGSDLAAPVRGETAHLLRRAGRTAGLLVAPPAPRIHLGFRWLPAAGRSPAGTILAVEGGPGYASTGSEPEWDLAMTGPLLATRSLLLVNLRGTGTSTPVNCRRLEERVRRQSSTAGTSTSWWRPAVPS